MDTSPPRIGLGLTFGRGTPVPGSPLLDFDGRNIDGSNNGTLTDAQLLLLWKNLGSLGSAADVGTVSLTAPTYRAVATAGKLNNLPGVQSPGSKIMSSGSVTLNQPLTWAWVFQNTGSGTQVVSGGAPSDQFSTTGDPGLNFYAGSTVDPGLTYGANTWESLIFTFNGGSSSGTFNGVPFSSGNPGTDGNGSINLFNNFTASFGMIGFIARVLCWGAGAPSQATIAAYLDAIYGANPQ